MNGAPPSIDPPPPPSAGPWRARSESLAIPGSSQPLTTTSCPTSAQTYWSTARWAHKSKFFDADRVIITRGDWTAWRRLAHWHYRSHRTPPPTQIWVAHIRHADAVTRWHGHRDRVHLAGVLVVSHPHPLSRARNIATRNRYGNLRPKEHHPAIDADFRVISRVVVDPTYRGLGLSVRLVRTALDHHETPYIESYATMGRVMPMMERAGMTRYDIAAPNHDARLTAALRAHGLTLTDLARPPAEILRRAALHPPPRLSILDELAIWWRAEHPGHPDDPTPSDPTIILIDARSAVPARPIYYLWKAPNA